MVNKPTAHNSKLNANALVTVVGLQYYHIAKIVLAVSTAQAKVSSYESLREGRKREVILYLFSCWAVR